MHLMRRIAWAFMLLLAAGIGTAAAGESAVAAIRKSGVLRVAMFAGDTPPFYFVDKSTGKLIGYDVDIANGIAQKLGVKAEIKRYGPPFAKVTDAIDSGEADLLISYTSITPQRAETYSCVIYDSTYFAFLLDIPRLEKAVGREIIEPIDLNSPDVNIFVQGQTPFEGILKKAYPKAKPVPITTNNDVSLMIKGMDAGEALVSFDRELVFLIFSRINPTDFKRYSLHILPDILNPAGMIMPKGSDLAPVVQEYIDGRGEVMELADIIDKYMKF